MGRMGVLHRDNCLEVLAGPFRDKPKRHHGKPVFGVCLTERPQAGTDLHFPIRDFSVPDMRETQKLVDQIVHKMMRRQPVYVGCMMGQGRTGTILACVAKAFKAPGDPTLFVRANYNRHAVETPQQRAFVDNFTPSWRTIFRLWTGL